MQASQILTRPKIRIVVFASGWNPKQEYDNNLVKSFVKDGYSVDMVSYDQNTKTINPQMSYATAYNYTVGGNAYVKRKAKNLLNADEMQKVKKELNDNANQYEHTVYINGFGSEDRGTFHESYKDILTEGQDHTCLNWCTCCQAPQQYSEEPTKTPCNCNILFPSKRYHGYHIRYDDKENTYQYLIMPYGNIVRDTIVEEGDITDEQRTHVR